MKTQQAITGHARGKLPFAPEGWPFIIPLVILSILFAVLQWVVVFALIFALTLFVINFFRDPERDTPREKGVFISPADGKVIRAETTEKGVRIDIFMNVFNVHVNRAPDHGRIRSMTYFPGKFVNASFDKASTDNERNRFELETDDGCRIAFTQIAGLIARRIVSYVAVGDRVKRGQRVGMIRFGSRVDCEFPTNYVCQVKVGDHVQAGSTILARKDAA